MLCRRRMLPGWLLLALLGCAETRQEKPSTFLDRLASTTGLGPNAVQLEIAHIRQPLGDSFLNDGLWYSVDEQVLPLEQRPRVEANGYRLGVISGTPPSQLQDLLISESSCISARRLAMRAGHTAFLPLGGVTATCALHIHDDQQEIQLIEAAEPIPRQFQDAQLGLAIEASAQSDGNVRLRIEPRVQHGEYQLFPKASHEEGDWRLLPGRPEERFSQLTWEVPLAPNQYLVIGGLIHEDQTLGQSGFTQASGERPRQDLLVIRLIPSSRDPAVVALSRRMKSPPPLAIQSAR